MRAIVQVGYGATDEVLRLEEVETPQLGDDEVLVRVRAASVHPDIWHVVTGLPHVLRLTGAGSRRPKERIPGTDLAGLVEAVGQRVTDFRPGDAVFGESRRGMPWRNGGTFAEYAAVSQDLLALKPGKISFEQAAAVPTSGTIALNNLQQGRLLQSARRVLVNGAAGGVGSVSQMVKLMSLSPFNRHLPKSSFAPPGKKATMAILRDHLVSGVLKPVIDRSYPLEEATEALRYLQPGRDMGKIVITP